MIVLLFPLFLSLSLSFSLSFFGIPFSSGESLAGPSRCCLDLPFCCNRFLNLPLIPRLSRFFSSFFHLSFPSFHLFVVPLLLLVFFFTLLLLSSPTPLLSPPFCTVSLLRGLSPAPFAGERYAPTGFELSRIHREGLLWREIESRSQSLRRVLFLALEHFISFR